MKKCVILKGLPGSGKSTWAKELLDKEPGRYKRISKDDLRAMLDNGKWSKGNEKFILKVRDSLIVQALQEGYHVLVDDTNLHGKHEQAIRELVKGLALVEIKDFTDVPIETCIERDLARPKSVGERVIRYMYRDFLQCKPVPPPYIKGLPDALIVDMDGTLALLNGRNPYDASTCEQDSLNEPIADIVRSYRDQDYEILLVSGREDTYFKQTENWLFNHRIYYSQLWMRKAGDYRKDSVIKREIYEQHIQGKYNILFAVDDRSSTVATWRALGLTCLQVGEGDF